MKLKTILFICIVSFCSIRGHAEIYDCFLFFNELEILEMRLNELYDHVDKFVLVESTKTFRGASKPLYYKNNKKRFAKFQDKIIHIIVKNSPRRADPWTVDFFQRDQIARGLRRCKPNDIIMISDVDEIVRPSNFPLIIQMLNEGAPAVKCGQDYFRYYLNARESSGLYADTVVTTYKYLKKHTTPNALRWQRRDPALGFVLLPDAGWHFTSMGGLDRVIRKFESWAHVECDLPANKTAEAIFDHVHNHCTIMPIDETFPKWIRDNESLLRERGFIL